MNIDEMLEVKNLYHVMIEITTDCNMRCSYCLVSQPSWQFLTLNSGLAHRLIDEIKALEPFVVHIHGHGETTMIDGWCDYADKLFDAGIGVSICTNLSKTYDDREIDFLSRMTGVTVSLDTIDVELFSKLRRGGDIRNVLYNLIRVATRARVMGRDPKISWSIVVCDKSMMGLLDLVHCGIGLGIHAMTFCNLGVGPTPKGALEVQHVAEMPVDDCKRALEIFTEIEAHCLQNGIVCDIKQGILDSLNHKIQTGQAHWAIPVHVS